MKHEAGWIWATYRLNGHASIYTLELSVEAGWTDKEIIERLAKRHKLPKDKVDLRVAA